MKKKQEQQLSKQKTMRQLLQTETQIPNGLTWGGISFCERYKDTSYLYE